MQQYDKAAIKAWEGTQLNFGMLNVSSLTWLRPDAHYGRGATHSNSSSGRIVVDCSHYKIAAGGVPDTWVRGLAAVLEARAEPIVADHAANLEKVTEQARRYKKQRDEARAELEEMKKKIQKNEKGPVSDSEE